VPIPQPGVSIQQPGQVLVLRVVVNVVAALVVLVVVVVDDDDKLIYRWRWLQTTSPAGPAIHQII
jgi:hypothetical protein